MILPRAGHGRRERVDGHLVKSFTFKYRQKPQQDLTARQLPGGRAAIGISFTTGTQLFLKYSVQIHSSSGASSFESCSTLGDAFSGPDASSSSSPVTGSTGMRWEIISSNRRRACPPPSRSGPRTLPALSSASFSGMPWPELPVFFSLILDTHP